MSEDLGQRKARAQAAKLELPEAERILGEMRDESVAALFASTAPEREAREDLYRAVHAIDHLLKRLRRDAADLVAVEHIESLQPKG